MTKKAKFTAHISGKSFILAFLLFFALTACERKNLWENKSRIDLQFDPYPGTYSNDQNIELICDTADAVIYYTTDGSTPTELSNIYNAPIPVTGSGTSMTISAFATRSGMIDSNIISGLYTIDYLQVFTPVIELAAGLYNSDQTVSITCSTSGATIYYTTDGSTPTESSAVYSSAIPVTGNGTDCTINAIAMMTGMDNSGIASSIYQIRYVIYYTLNDYIYISKDSAVTWTDVNFSGNAINCVFAYQDEIYVGGNAYLNYFDGSGWTIRPAIIGNVVGLFIDPNYLYV